MIFNIKNKSYRLLPIQYGITYLQPALILKRRFFPDKAIPLGDYGGIISSSSMEDLSIDKIRLIYHKVLIKYLELNE